MEQEIFNEVNHLHGAHKAAAIMWAFTIYELARHPEWQDKCRREIVTAKGERECLLRTDIPKLKHTMCVWKEVLRMHPVRPTCS